MTSAPQSSLPAGLGRSCSDTGHGRKVCPCLKAVPTYAICPAAESVTDPFQPICSATSICLSHNPGGCLSHNGIRCVWRQIADFVGGLMLSSIWLGCCLPSASQGAVTASRAQLPQHQCTLCSDFTWRSGGDELPSNACIVGAHYLQQEVRQRSVQEFPSSQNASTCMRAHSCWYSGSGCLHCLTCAFSTAPHSRKEQR